MRILLIQSNRVSRGVVALDGIEIPLNILYLSAALEKPKQTLIAYGNDIDNSTKDLILNEKFIVDILDLQFFSSPWNEIENKINEFNPDIIGITGVTVQANSVKNICNFIKKLNNNVIIIYGGIHASSLPEYSLKEMTSVDFIVIGEGEITLLELCSRLPLISNLNLEDYDSSLKKINGIAFRSKTTSEVIITGPRPLIQNLDELPYPSREKIKQKKYRPIFANYWKLPTTGIIASRGCPFNCNFCAKTIFKRIYRLRSPQNVINEMIYCSENFGINDFRFYDDSLTTNRKWVIEFCKILIQMKRESNISFTWNGWSRVDTVSLPILRLMKEAGCFHLKYGAESASNKILNEVNKGQTKNDIIKAFKYSRKVGIETKACIMFNFLDESENSIRNTIEFVKMINPEYATFTILKPLPGSAIFKEAEEKGWLIHKNWDLYSQEDPPVMKPQIEKGFNPKIIRNAYNSFYMRPKYIYNHIISLIKFPSLRKIYRLVQGLIAFLPSNK